MSGNNLQECVFCGLWGFFWLIVGRAVFQRDFCEREAFCVFKGLLCQGR